MGSAKTTQVVRLYASARLSNEMLLMDRAGSVLQLGREVDGELERLGFRVTGEPHMVAITGGQELIWEVVPV